MMSSLNSTNTCSSSEQEEEAKDPNKEEKTEKVATFLSFSSCQPSAPVKEENKQKEVAVTQNLDNNNQSIHQSIGSEVDAFVDSLRAQIETFVTRMKSNSSLGCLIANDTAIQNLFLNITTLHSQLLDLIQVQDNTRIDFCCQTDLEEDPEIYYFAGGRHVQCQTIDDGEYEPLQLFTKGTKLEIIVLSNSTPSPPNDDNNTNDNNNTTSGLQSVSSSISSPSTIELECGGVSGESELTSSLSLPTTTTTVDISSSMNIKCSIEKVPVPVKIINEDSSSITSTTVIGIETEKKVKVEEQEEEVKDNTSNNNNNNNYSDNNSSCSNNSDTNKGIEEKGDGWKTVTTRSNRTKWSQSSSSLGSSAANSSRGSLDRSSVGDYRDRASVGSGSNSGSVIGRGRLNSSGSGRLGSPSHFNSSTNSSNNNNKNKNNSSSGNNNNSTNRTGSIQRNHWNSSLNGRGTLSNATSSANYLKSRFYQPSSTISLPVLNHPVDESGDSKKYPSTSSTHGVKRQQNNNNNQGSESGYGSREKLIRKKTSLVASNTEAVSTKPKTSSRPSSQQRSTQTIKKPGLVSGSTSTTKIPKEDNNNSNTLLSKRTKNDVLTSTTSLATSLSLLSSSSASPSVHSKSSRTTIGKPTTTTTTAFQTVTNSSSTIKLNNVKVEKDNKSKIEKTNPITTTTATTRKIVTSTTNNGLVTNSSTRATSKLSNSKISPSQINTSSIITTNSTNSFNNLKKSSQNSTNTKVGMKSNGITLGNNNNNNNKKEKDTSNLTNKLTTAVAIKPLLLLEVDKTAATTLDREDPMQDSTNSDLDMQNDNDKWKVEQDTESSNDDEEIQRKDAALESIQGTLELLQLELLQVEKDFEEIENRAPDNVSVDEGSNISESDTTSSPSTFLESEAGDTMSDFGGDLDQFFFIAIDENTCLNSEDVIEEKILAKKEKLRLSPARLLTSPSIRKKCDSAETLKRHRAKLANAERNREKLLQSKYNRYVELSERFASLNETTKRLVEERSELMMKANERRNRAAEKRKLHLKSIVKKAHDEDSKAKEIAFINLLEAQNKRHDYLANVQEVEDRLNSIQEERKLKFEDRAIKVQAVIERQDHIRRGWESKLAELQEKRRKVDERIMRTKEEKAKERSELAQEKARDREERLSALNAAKQAEKEELQKKIQQKQEETARRHEENIEQIRQKAIELTLPRTPADDPTPATIRICSLCKVTMQSEVQELAHLRGRPHLDAVRKMEQENGGSKIENFGLKFITDVQVDKVEPGIRHDKNRNKKHCKKLMLKLITNGEEFEKNEKEQRVEKPWGDPTLKAKVVKNLKELDRSINLFSAGKGSLSISNSMDKLLADVRRTVNKNKSVQDAMVSLQAFNVTSKILQCTADDLPPKVLIGACNLIVGATYQHLKNGIYVIRSTIVCSLINLVVNRLNNLIPDGNRWLSSSPLGSTECKLQADSVADFAIETLLTLLSIVPDPFDGITRKDNALKDAEVLEIITRTQDIIGYLVSANVIDRLSVYCSGVQGPVDSQPGVANLLKISIDFLTALVWCLTFCLEKRSSLNGGKRESDPTQLLATLESSELAGSVSMSYALLLYQGAPTRPRTSTTLTTSGNEISDSMHSSTSSTTSSSSSSSSTSCSSSSSTSSSVSVPPGVRTASVVKSTLCLINAVARLDIQALQNVLGSEAVSLQFRHIASQLLWQVTPHREDRTMWGLLQELFIAIGNFTVKNKHNQVTIQSGQTPTVLQQLCGVAKEFLSDIRLSRTILPTLIAATHGCRENRELLVQEDFPVDLLDGFLTSKFSHANLILKRLVTPPPTPSSTTTTVAAEKVSTSNKTLLVNKKK